MTWRDLRGVRHLVTGQVTNNGSATFQSGKHPETVQAWMRCGEVTWAPFDVTTDPVDCMTCLVKGAT
jgi:hypothetical protein